MKRQILIALAIVFILLFVGTTFAEAFEVSAPVVGVRTVIGVGAPGTGVRPGIGVGAPGAGWHRGFG
jgi:small neutral amino acid transporter SnatA (MarC family)